MARYWVIATVALLAFGTAPISGARDRGGFLEASENPLLGTWLLSEERLNPVHPIRCANMTLTFTHTPGTYNLIRPNQVAVGYMVYTMIDHDHMLIDEIPGCLYQRGPLDGTTPLLDRLKAEAEARRQGALQPPAPLPRTTTAEEAQIAIECMGDTSKPGCMTVDQALERIDGMKEAGPAPATTDNPETRRSMDQLNRAILDLREQARRQTDH
jgi:hypothetical protein